MVYRIIKSNSYLVTEELFSIWDGGGKKANGIAVLLNVSPLVRGYAYSTQLWGEEGSVNSLT